jgi:endonuclease/exonuclease/phosphatase family metal-dependent hydrolase
MKFLTFNVRIDAPSDGTNEWKNRIKSVAEVLKAGDYPIVGLQEPTMKMLKELIKEIPHYRYAGTARDERGEMTPILYQVEKVRLLTNETIWLSKTKYAESKFEDSNFNRIATIAVFETNGTMEMFRFVNTHLDYANPDVQKRQMSVLIDHLNKQSSIKRLPTIIVGDFNATLDKPVHQYLKKSSLNGKSLTSIYGDENPKATYHQFEGILEGEPIDYVYYTEPFVKAGFVVIRDKFFQVYPSDHYPVEFSLNFINK